MDAKLRLEMRHELRELVERLAITALYVTHDQEEALAVSDRIALMQDGHIVEEGDPRKMYDCPDSVLTAAGIGESNRIEGELAREGSEGKEGIVSSSLGEVFCSVPERCRQGEKVTLLFRPEDVVLHTATIEHRVNFWAGTVEAAVYLGKRIECSVRIGEQLLRCEADSQAVLKKGQTVSIEVPLERIRVFPS